MAADRARASTAARADWTFFDARAACLADPSLQLETQLSRGELQALCLPDDRASPPCLGEWLFDIPSGNASGWQQYAQCEVRRTDAAWPTLEPHLKRTRRTRTMADLVRLVGAARFTIVGSSDAQQLFDAMQCALRRHGLGASHGHLWRKWGWANYATDNGGCALARAHACNPCMHPAVPSWQQRFAAQH